MRNFLKTDHTTTDDETQPDENGDTAMSLDTAAPGRDERAAYSGVDENKAAAGPIAAPDSELDDDQPKPTFTPTLAADDGSGPATGSDPAYHNGNFTRAMPAMTSAADEPVTALPADEPVAAAVPMDEPVAALPADESAAGIRANQPAVASTTTADEPVAAPAAENEPLLANTELMRASWQQVQAGFVDDPKAAVSDAADLIDHTVQALVETLQQRQRQLRDISGNGVTNSNGFGSAGPGDVPDTEQLRLTMQRYRSLFNQLVNS
jgi:hypothetical protein